MDRERFDALARVCATSSSRRAAVAALFGAGLAGAVGQADARKKDRKARRRNGIKAKGTVGAEATCASPGPSSNLSGCNFDDADFSGDDLSGSRMVGTRFRNATLVGTNLSSSNMKDATFRGADLTCADLSSSTLKNADFRGFAYPGNTTDLTGADLSSSACGGIQFNGRTRFCRTRLCNGSFNDEDCPGGVAPEGFCCSDDDCPGDQGCDSNQCVCPDGWIVVGNGNCGFPCVGQPACLNIGCSVCANANPGGQAVCFGGAAGLSTCAVCPVGSSCSSASAVCRELCGPPTT